MALVTVATCQFPTSGDVAANLGHISKQLRMAKQRGADVAHFPEGALSGYVPSDLDSFEGYDWDALRQATRQILDLAGRLGIWVVVGSAHRLSDGHKPHNSLYVIDDAGRLVDRYDKRFCAGGPDGRTEELAHYSPGDHGSVWEINGVRCGALICYEYRFPELHREYARDGVQPPLDQLPELLGAGEPLAVVLRSRRRHHGRTAAAQPGRRPHLRGRHGRDAVYDAIGMAGSGARRCPPQRHAGHRSSVERSNGAVAAGFVPDPCQKERKNGGESRASAVS